MRYGFILPGGSAAEQLELAVLAETAGWDGVFVCEAGYGLDPWCLLSVMAVRTERIRLGTMLTALPWRRPWKLAGQLITLDQLSAGRAVLTVGLGAPDAGHAATGEQVDRRIRAERLDEGLDILFGLMSGAPVHQGRHYQVDLTEWQQLSGPLRPVQQPRIPVWVVGAWPRPRSMQRVVRCDGLVPYCLDPQTGGRQTRPADVPEMLAWIDGHGGRRPGFDVVIEGETAAGDPAGAATVAEWERAGGTWWLESRWALVGDEAERMRALRERLAAGPPRPVSAG